MPKRAAAATRGGSAGGSGAKHQRAREPLLDSYEGYLRGLGAWWAEDLVRVRPPGEGGGALKVPPYLVHEWGIVSLGKSVKAGTEICRVPRSACFGEELPALREGEDTQMNMAVKLVKEREKGPASDHWPKLQTLPETVPVCWGWPEADRALLKGTELCDVTSAKLARLKREWDEHASEHCSEFEEYLNACTVVISHANPWWGVSMVPFVDMGNHSDEKPHVEFRKKGSYVVGTALRGIPKLSEVYQSYGELGTADLIYRYGFVRPSVVPREEDTVSLDAETIAAAADGTASDGSVSLSGERIGQLLESGLIDSSPWDGMESVKTVEISLSEASQGGLRVDGLPELLVCMYLLLLPEARWRSVLRLSAMAALVLSGEIHADDMGAVSTYIGVEAESSNSNNRSEAQPAQTERETVDQVIALLRERCKVSGVNLQRRFLHIEGQDERARSAREEKEAEEEEEHEDEEEEADEDEEGVEWRHLVGDNGEVVSWLRSEGTLSASRTALKARAERYRCSALQWRGE